MPFANLGFETGVGGEPGSAASWFHEYGVSVELWAPYAGPEYIEDHESFEYWTTGWSTALGSVSAALYAATFLVTPVAYEAFAVGWETTPWLTDLGATAAAAYGVGLLALEAFEVEWSNDTWQTALGATATASYDTSPENFEDHEEDWSNASWQLGLGSTASAVYDNGGEVYEDFEEVLAPIAFSLDPATGTLTAPAHGLTNGTLVRLATTGQLPGGMSPALDYYVVTAAANTLQLSRTVGGAALTYSHQGGGTQTLLVDPTRYWNDVISI